MVDVRIGEAAAYEDCRRSRTSLKQPAQVYGRRSQAYRMVYAMEQWAARHGYEGHKAHIVPTKKDKVKQQVIQWQA